MLIRRGTVTLPGGERLRRVQVEWGDGPAAIVTVTGRDGTVAFTSGVSSVQRVRAGFELVTEAGVVRVSRGCGCGK